MIQDGLARTNLRHGGLLNGVAFFDEINHALNCDICKQFYFSLHIQHDPKRLFK